MKFKVLPLALVAMLASTLPAFAHDGRHGNFFLGLGVGAAAVGIGSALLSPPVYAAPVYAPPPVYYAPPPPVYYAPPPVVYAPAPYGYYAPAPAYYGY